MLFQFLIENYVREASVLSIAEVFVANDASMILSTGFGRTELQDNNYNIWCYSQNVHNMLITSFDFGILMRAKGMKSSLTMEG